MLNHGNSWTELNLAALRGNIGAVRAALDPSCDLVCVVKADAYGNGMLAVAACAWAEGVKRFAVVHLYEALALRRTLPAAEVYMLGLLDPAAAVAAAEANLVTPLVSTQQAEELARSCRQDGLTLRCHAMVDSGMGRLGFAWPDAAEAVCAAAGLAGLTVEAMGSHFAAGGGRDGFAEEQFARFKTVLDACRGNGLKTFNHVCNSAGLQRGTGWALDAVRCGILLYGYGHDPHADARRVLTRPCLQWRTRVVQVKQVPAGFPVSYDRTYTTAVETRLATINVGYADGYARLLSNRGCVLIGGQRCPVVGRVTMNMTVVDVGPHASVRAGDVVTLLGEDGAEAIWADEIAAWRDTISYEVLTSIRCIDRRVVET